VSFIQLKEELEEKVEQAARRAAEAAVSEMEKRGFSKKT
jgi:Ni,Fe-hydrogenase maturation factor